ncbi:Uu.00g040570.m01.CDS01 [Anthostomella pinea]|uniref:Uu.00g040570.m01.CDS01 n=1 Tax=Anthostomella pinea TaxID=933095 RepID=A0AAI8VA37_9PEZI|nr:Uu.00g040570.m01.CDS01 [Anthostomella pinea]
MATQHFGLLEEREETELHKTRLLNVEEKPFKRLAKRLVAPGAFTNPTSKLPSPPPDASSAEAQNASQESTDVTALKEDITLDFAAFDSAIARLQFLATANAAERERYAADRLRILGTMESVRESNNVLKTSLETARETLARRRTFDELADKITANRMLRTRAEQAVNLAKLAEECDELRRESETYGDTWRERREQFERLVDEGKRLRALIRDEKEEVERREGMDSDAEDGEAGAAGSTPKAVNGNATPHHGENHIVSSSKVEGNATPISNSGRDERTPRPDSPGAATTNGGESLKPRPDASRSFSRAGSQAPSPRAGSQQPPPADEGPEEGEDVEMNESQATQQAADTPMAETPQITVDAPTGPDDAMDTT